MKNKYKILVAIFVIASQILIAQAQEYSSTVNLGQQELSIREIRTTAISGNIGWNGLTGIGVTYNNYFAKNIGIDLGVGLSTTGVKIGGRLNYFFSDKNFSPLASAGVNYGFGLGDTEVKFRNDNTGNEFNYKISASPFAQIGGGIEYMSDGGFMFRGLVGYAILLTDSNYKITKGVPSKDEKAATTP